MLGAATNTWTIGGGPTCSSTFTAGSNYIQNNQAGFYLVSYVGGFTSAPTPSPTGYRSFFVFDSIQQRWGELALFTSAATTMTSFDLMYLSNATDVKWFAYQQGNTATLNSAPSTSFTIVYWQQDSFSVNAFYVNPINYNGGVVNGLDTVWGGTSFSSGTKVTSTTQG